MSGEGVSGSADGHLSTAPSDEWRQREGEKAAQLTRQLWASGDKHKNEEKATSTVRTALLGWPDHACACRDELRHRRAPGGVNGVETRMVAKFGTLRQAGK